MGLADELDRQPGNVDKLVKLLADADVPIDKVRVDKASVWEGFYKDSDGEAQKVTLHGLSVKAFNEPDWPVVQQAKPVSVKPRRANPVTGSARTALLVPDSQIGYIGDEAMHDEAALDIVVSLAAAPEVTDIVLLGDMLDLAGMSRFGGPPTLTQRVQPALDRMHEWLAQIRAAAPLASIAYLEGNHEARMARTLAANAAEAFGLRRANVPESWPVLSPPYLLRLDELGIAYHGGYPAGAVWLRDDIKILHGKRTSAERASKDNIAGVSQFFGHSHRLEVKSNTREGRGGSVLASLHVSCGTLARVDGVVPSYGSGTDDAGLPVRSVEDWQAGCVLLSFDADDVGVLPTVELVPFHNGTAVWRGRKFVA